MNIIERTIAAIEADIIEMTDELGYCKTVAAYQRKMESIERAQEVIDDLKSMGKE